MLALNEDTEMDIYLYVHIYTLESIKNGSYETSALEKTGNKTFHFNTKPEIDASIS